MFRYTATPLKLVGLEGLFGVLTISIIMPIAHFSFGHDTKGFFDLVHGYQLFVSSPIIWLSGIGSALSIAVFNYCGLNVTRYISATSRTTIDTCRTLFIWIISLGLGWETFLWLQVVGFIVLIYGTFVFNNVIPAVPAVVSTWFSRRYARL